MNKITKAVSDAIKLEIIKENYYEGGVIIPYNENEQILRGKIIDIGPLVKDYKIGDEVVIRKLGTFNIDEHVFVSDSQVLALLIDDVKN